MFALAQRSCVWRIATYCRLNNSAHTKKRPKILGRTEGEARTSICMQRQGCFSYRTVRISTKMKTSIWEMSAYWKTNETQRIARSSSD